MPGERREFSISPLPPPITTRENTKNSRAINYERPPTGIASNDAQDAEAELRHLLEKDITTIRKNGFCVCRQWQLLLTLNITIIVITIILMLLLIFLIGPLAPYQTYGQSCSALSCNSAHGLVCSAKSLCICPSSDSYWSRNETGCRRCPSGWSTINDKCIFVSSFYLNWTEAFTYCKSLNAELLTFSSTSMYSSITLSQINASVSSGTNYFIGLSEQPNDSGNWSWVDGSPLSSSSSSLFCSNGSTNQFETFFRVNMNCVMYRMDSCLARYPCQRADVNFICEKI